MTAVALTGGIASGKSTVARLLEEHGIPLLDTDVVAFELSQAGGQAIPALEAAFGRGCLTDMGALDRPRMRELAFSDPSARARLEGILHPMIRDKVEAFLLKHQGRACVVAIPLFFESLNYRTRFDCVVTVDCATSTQRERLIRERGMEPGLAEAILLAQTQRTIRLQLADRVLVNNADLESLEAQVANWLGIWS